MDDSHKLSFEFWEKAMLVALPSTITQTESRTQAAELASDVADSALRIWQRKMEWMTTSSLVDHLCNVAAQIIKADGIVDAEFTDNTDNGWDVTVDLPCPAEDIKLDAQERLQSLCKQYQEDHSFYVVIVTYDERMKITASEVTVSKAD